MTAIKDFLVDMRSKHDRMNEVLSTASEDHMGAVGPWGDQQLPIRAMVYRLINHEIEHTVHAVKTLRDLGILKSEVEIILARLQEARGDLEGVLVGVSDEQFDLAPEGEWSLRQVLEHIISTEDTYSKRIQEALTGIGSS